MLFPHSNISIWLPIDAFLLAFQQMFVNTYTDVTMSDPFKKPGPDTCTNVSDLYTNGTLPRCPDKYATYPAFIFMSIYLLLTNLLLFNLLIAIFSTAYEKIEGSISKLYLNLFWSVWPNVNG